MAVGVGARSGTPMIAFRVAVDAALLAAGLTRADVTVLATVERRAADPGVRDLALDRGWRLLAVAGEELAAQAVPNPSTRVAAAVGTPSVAEAAALVAAGPSGSLLLPKRSYGGVTVAVARSATAGLARSPQPPLD